MIVEELFEDVWHLGFVVHDVEITAKKLKRLLGITSWILRVIEPHFAQLHGEDVSHVFKIAMGDIGNIKIELLQPVKGESVYTEYLKERGEGFHHIAIRIPEKKLVEVLDDLKKKGGEIVQTGKVGAGPGYYYIDLKEMDLVLELNPTK